MQAERVAGFQAFIDDVQKGGFPGPGELVDAPDGLIDGFLEAVEGD
jgi:ketopantoate hydroxymethyltransferase